MQNLLTSNPNLASVLAARDKLLPLFECFSIPIASDSNIPQLCLRVLSCLTTHAPCLEAMVADGSSLLLLLQMLHSAPNCREGVLHVLYALASTPELAWAAAKHGGVVYILELLLPSQGKIFILSSQVAIKIKRNIYLLLKYNHCLQKRFPCSKEQQLPHCWGSLLGSQCMGLEWLLHLQGFCQMG